MLLRLLEHHGMHTTTVATLVVLLGLVAVMKQTNNGNNLYGGVSPNRQLRSPYTIYNDLLK